MEVIFIIFRKDETLAILINYILHSVIYAIDFILVCRCIKIVTYFVFCKSKLYD